MLANLMEKMILPCFVIWALSLLPQKWSHGQSSVCGIHWTAKCSPSVYVHPYMNLFSYLQDWGGHHLDPRALHPSPLNLIVNPDTFKVSLGNITDAHVDKQEGMTAQGQGCPIFCNVFDLVNQLINLTKQYFWAAEGCLNLPQSPITVIHGFLLFLTHRSGSAGLDVFSEGNCSCLLPRLSAYFLRAHL